MAIKKQPAENFIISPFDALHFILDIPIIKDSYQVNAVKFAMKTLYPGNDEKSVFDYFYNKKTVVGIAADSDLILSYKQRQRIIISPAKLAFLFTKNGIVVFLTEDWVALFHIKNSSIVLMKKYISLEYSILFKDIAALNTQDEIIIFNLSGKNIKNTFLQIDDKIRVFDSICSIKKSILKKAQIFTSKSRKKYSGLLKLFLIGICLVFSVVNYSLQKKSSLMQEKIKVLKNEYQTKKKDLSNVRDSERHEETVISNTTSVYSILSELSKSAKDMRVIYFTVDKENFRIDAECSNAVSVFEYLSDNNLFEEIVLHQVLPQKNRTEKFSISGRIKND